MTPGQLALPLPAVGWDRGDVAVAWVVCREWMTDEEWTATVDAMARQVRS